MKSIPGPDILEYVDTYHIDTVVVIWKAEDQSEAERAREYVDGDNPASVQDVDCALYYKSTFGPLSGMVFFAFGQEGCHEDDGVILDNFAAGIPCETEMWFGAGDDVYQTRPIKLPNYEKVA